MVYIIEPQNREQLSRAREGDIVRAIIEGEGGLIQVIYGGKQGSVETFLKQYSDLEIHKYVVPSSNLTFNSDTRAVIITGHPTEFIANQHGLNRIVFNAEKQKFIEAGIWREQ